MEKYQRREYPSHTKTYQLQNLTTEEEKGIRGGRVLPTSGFGAGPRSVTTTTTHEYDGGTYVQDSEPDTD